MTKREHDLISLVVEIGSLQEKNRNLAARVAELEAERDAAVSSLEETTYHLIQSEAARDGRAARVAELEAELREGRVEDNQEWESGYCT